MTRGLRATFQNIHACLEVIDNEDDILYFPGMFENPVQSVKTKCERNIN